uniref:Pre-mRNA-splicing factor SYF2 n=1 Tax=Setaria digitata TaxID=48799 RepID=A0A915Q216_9BILA
MTDANRLAETAATVLSERWVLWAPFRTVALLQLRLDWSRQTSEMESTPGASNKSPESSASTRKHSMEDRFKEKFTMLHQKRQESRKLNYEQVIEEDRRSKLPKNYDLRRKRQEWELEQMELKKAAEERGEDYDRLQALKTQADLVERKEAAKKMKRPDKGFSDYETMTLRQYQRLSGNIKPDMKTYEKMREVIDANEFYPGVNTLISGTHYPTDAALNKLAEDIRAQEKKRDQYHRRRMFDPDAPIDYINERNRKFNQKLDRFYDKYTEDLKSDLERGTAV